MRGPKLVFLLLIGLLLVVCGAVASEQEVPVSSSSGSSTAPEPHESHHCIFETLRRQQALENVTSLVRIRPTRQQRSDPTNAMTPIAELYHLGRTVPSSASSAKSTFSNAAAAESTATSGISVTVPMPTETTPRPGFAPIRIVVFTADLEEGGGFCTKAGESVTDHKGGTLACTEEHILTDAKKTILLTELVPAALRLHAERLMVESITGSIQVQDLSFSAICGSFTVPVEHTTEGVEGADMVVYLAAGPTSSGTVAWATGCSYDSNGRPAVGVINFSPQYIANTTDMQRVLAHELLHAMGFSGSTFDAHDMLTTLPSLRGKPDMNVVSSTTVQARTRTQFGCDTAVGMELEDEGGSGTSGSHWKRRNALVEIMSGVSNIGFYSALTIAAMHDLGFYQGVFENAEPLSWGANVGCDFLDKKCVENGTTTFPSMFCTKPDAMACAPDRRGMGYCGITTFAAPLDEPYRYFANANMGGSAGMMDYCPLYTASTSSICTESTGSIDYTPGAYFSASSRCLDAQYVKVKDVMGTQNGICTNIKCDGVAQTYQIWFAGGTEWIACPEGDWIDPSLHSDTFTFGAVQCAPYGSVCGITGQETDTVGFNNSAATVTALLASRVLALVLAVAFLF